VRVPRRKIIGGASVAAHLRLLALERNATSLGKRYGSAPNPVTAFAAALKAGRLIQSISVEHFPDRDDDELTFHFSKPDPALAPFQVT
jgi:hypothetical protein